MSQHYNEAYKREAVAKASGNVSQTAREMGINNKSLHGWIKDYGDPRPEELRELCQNHNRWR